ncbi:2-hydroxychromene-2-carboxylate isomerase [Lacibacterium aquatile]|uniref:2-hydroxychromene-2-carboxylate isomerase n=1 Tax=Lacibacterium aquatile TaxID=1168082 RepID=A0ABW5DSD2_9PROT
MEKIVEYFYTPISPFVYLGAARFRAICAEHGATIHHKPIEMARVFPAAGALPLAQRPQQRQAYRLVELKRWSDFLGLPMVLEPTHFPVPATNAACLILAARDAGYDPLPLTEAIGEAVWLNDRDVSDPATLIELADNLGLPGRQLITDAASNTVVDTYMRYTDEAISLGIFGAPTYCYRGEMFWGQDRLDFLSRALSEK